MEESSVQKPYNILMIAPTMFFADYGGHIRILEEAKILRRLGHTVTILTYPNGRDIADLDIRRCIGVPFNYRVEVGASRHKFYLDVMLGLKSLAHIMRHKPNIIHGHMHEGALIGWILSKLTGAPLIFDFQGSLTGEMVDNNFLKPESTFLKIFRRIEAVINRKAKVILTSSHHAARLLRESFAIEPGRIHPTPDCVDASTFNPATTTTSDDNLALKQALGIPLEKQVIVYAGILTRHQGTDHLLQALRLLQSRRGDFHLLLMGYPYVAHYQAMARDLGVDHLVTFTGKMPYEQLPRHLALGDIATAPKMSDTEGCGKILNYMSMALPTVVFDTPVSREFLGQSGVYASNYSTEALTDALDQALNLTSQDKRKIGRRLRLWAQSKYDWLKTGKQIELVYGAVLAGHPQPAVVVEQAIF